MSGDTFDFLQGARETITGTLHDPAATTGDVLTVQADKSIAAQPGGGSGGVQTVTVPVSSAQILDLANTDVTLVAGVPGSVIAVQNVTFAYVAGATPYTPSGGGVIVVTRSVSDPTGTLANWLSTTQTGFLDQAADQFLVAGYGQGVFTPSTTSEWDGQDVIIFASNGNPTLGDGTLLVTVSYFLAPTV